MNTRLSLVSLVLVMLSCSEPEEEYPAPRDPLPDPQMPADAEPSGHVVHAVDPFALAGSEETMTCYAWTVDNDAPLYVQGVEFQNGGSFHHSNWFVVPEDVYPGEDGFFPCSERGFEDVSAALAGTVLFAQSTQAQQESMRFTEGATIRIPARSKIVAGVHLLNLGPDARDTAAWMSLDVIHPALVEAIVVPFMLSYFDLNIPARQRAVFQGECKGSEFLDISRFALHYVLPHYHGTGTTATLSLFDGEEEVPVLDHQGFGASAMGQVFDPPLVVEDLSAITFSCGYDNPHDEDLTWGIGINEMCVVLGFASVGGVYIAGVEAGKTLSTSIDEDGTQRSRGACSGLLAPRGNAYANPIREEIAGPLILPNTDGPPPEVPSCVDVDVIGDGSTPTFAEVRDRVFSPWCSFSSCHGNGGAGGLMLDSAEGLVGVASTAVDMPRVTAGDPENSYLYRLLSSCDPAVDGVEARHMPAGAPTLLDPELVRLVRAWIESGAPS